MGPASSGLEIGNFCDLLYSVLLLHVIWGLYFLGRDLSRPQVGGRGRALGALRLAAVRCVWSSRDHF